MASIIFLSTSLLFFRLLLPFCVCEGTGAEHDGEVSEARDGDGIWLKLAYKGCETAQGDDGEGNDIIIGLSVNR